MEIRSGRQREAAEIVRYKKAAAVGRLLLGELDGPMEAIRSSTTLRRLAKNCCLKEMPHGILCAVRLRNSVGTTSKMWSLKTLSNYTTCFLNIIAIGFFPLRTSSETSADLEVEC